MYFNHFYKCNKEKVDTQTHIGCSNYSVLKWLLLERCMHEKDAKSRVIVLEKVGRDLIETGFSILDLS